MPQQLQKNQPTPLKIKDPKRVEAGKRLAEYNRKAKEKQKMVNESPQENVPLPQSWIPRYQYVHY